MLDERTMSRIRFVQLFNSASRQKNDVYSCSLPSMSTKKILDLYADVSCHGPASLSEQPPGHEHFPPKSTGRFSSGICCFNTSFELVILIFATVAGSSQPLITVQIVVNIQDEFTM